MCILLVSNLHPRYPVVILSNRDLARWTILQFHSSGRDPEQEFFDRPTERAHDWSTSINPPTQMKVIAGRDLEKGGTWLAINADNGRFAAVTNVREPSRMPANVYSRGFLVSQFVSSVDESAEEFVRDLRNHAGGRVEEIGGFSMIFGTLSKSSEGDDNHRIEELAICSNRDSQGKASNIEVEDLQWVLGEPDTIGISNGKLGDEEWNKVTIGRKLLREALEKSSVEDSESTLIESLFDILNFTPNPLDDLKNTIFVPSTLICSEGKSRLYGTRTQTVVLLDLKGHVKYTERTIYADDNEAPDRVIHTSLRNW